MNNDWDQLRYFLALARDKTLTRAGHSLQVSHSTVFRKIKAMEDELGVTLFENTSTGYSLTEAGLNLLEETEEVGEVIESSFRRLNGLETHPGKRYSGYNRIDRRKTAPPQFPEIPGTIS